MKRTMSLALLASIAMLSGCGRTDLSGPPAMRLGRDECAECGMLVNEDRCSCAMLIEREGRREYLVFDDLGCLLDLRDDAPSTTVVETFVHDYGTGEWTSGRHAHYLSAKPDAVPTPMGSGIVAFTTSERAAAQQARSGGATSTYDRLTEARRAWRNAQREQRSETP